MSYFGWLFDPANWTGSGGIPARLVEHLGYVALALLIALVIAVPLGAWVGHTGRGGFLVVGVGQRAARAAHARPARSLLVTPVRARASSAHSSRWSMLAVPADPGRHLRRGAQRRSGRASTPPGAWACAARRCSARVELPNALPLIIGGVRSAVLQVIATATIAAYVGLGGLGRFIIDGLAVRDYPQMVARLAPGRAARDRRRPAARRAAEARRLARPAAPLRARPAPAALAARHPSRSRPCAASRVVTRPGRNRLPMTHP